MNKGLRSLHNTQFNRGEIKFGIDKPGDNWVKANGTAVYPGNTLYYAGYPYIWTTATSNTTVSLNSVAYGDGLFVAVGNSATIRTSTDGLIWATQTPNTNNVLNEVAYGNNLWVAVGNNGTLRTSTDSITWTTRNPNTSNSINAIAYGNNLWVAGGNSGTLRTSTDAITWTTQTSNFGTTAILSVAYGNNLWVAGGSAGTLRTSTDAITWTTRTSNFGSTNITAIAYGNNLWFAGGTAGTLRTSTDGVTWATQTSNLGTGYGINSITEGILYGNKAMALCVDFAGGKVSPDYTTWYALNLGTLPTDSYNGIAYGNNLWVVVTNIGLIKVSPNSLPNLDLGNNIWGWIKQ
jgi:hypothetical protein